MTDGRSAWLAYSVIVFVAVWLRIETPAPIAFAMVSQTATAAEQMPAIRSEFVSTGLTEEVHSATAIELADGDIGVFWYAGTREGSADVAIYSRFLEKQENGENAAWSQVRKVVDRSDSIDGLHRHVRKLGNPVALYHKGELWLFYVTVSVGGWGGSSINLIKSGDNGKSWGDPQRLITSPFLNISTLVRERAVISRDGSVLLPVYHEFLGKFSELLRLDPSGEVIDKYRITHGKEAIQPTILPMSEKSAAVFMRNATETKRSAILTSKTDDGGVNWQPSSALELPNPNSAVTSVSLDRPNELLLVFNSHPKQRTDLTLAYAKDYQTGGSDQWQVLHEFENDAGQKPGEEVLHNPYSYPFLIKARTGDFHLFYSWKKRFIKYVYFNRAALNQMLQENIRIDLK